jgi:hypothetical protein
MSMMRILSEAKPGPISAKLGPISTKRLISERSEHN